MAAYFAEDGTIRIHNWRIQGGAQSRALCLIGGRWRGSARGCGPFDGWVMRFQHAGRSPAVTAWCADFLPDPDLRRALKVARRHRWPLYCILSRIPEARALLFEPDSRSLFYHLVAHAHEAGSPVRMRRKLRLTRRMLRDGPLSVAAAWQLSDLAARSLQRLPPPQWDRALIARVVKPTATPASQGG